jgi:preprotein translocase subunit SecG
MNITIYTIIASIIAGCGLLSNSIPAIIASMIVSPVLQPISKYLFINDKLEKKPIISTFILIFIFIITGIFMGILNNTTKVFDSESESMKNIISFDNNKPNSRLITEFLIAVSVGIGLPYAVIHGDTTLIVAFGIAPSIAPPLVNCGLYLSNHFMKEGNNNLIKSRNSFLLGIMHIFIITIISFIYSNYK